MGVAGIAGGRMAVRALLGLVVAGSLALGLGGRAPAGAYTPRVMIIDNDGSFSPGDPGTGMWGFSPDHIAVVQGEQLVFNNPAGNFRAHSVTSITASGQAPVRTLDSGTKFNSSPTRDDYIVPGSAWTLDTSTLDPGHYTYYCTIHPWMVGSITVMPAPAQ